MSTSYKLQSLWGYLALDVAPKQKIESVLSADVGSLWTRVVLVDVVGGEYRFVARAAAPTTAELPFADVTVGLYNAIADLERATGRKLVEEGHLIIPQLPNGSGIDAFIAASSAAPALRVALLALSRDITARSAVHAAESTYTNVLDLLTVDEHVHHSEAPLPEGEWLARQVQRLVALNPDLALIVGGVDGGSVAPVLKLADAVAAAAHERAAVEQSINATASQLPVIFAGNQSARGKVTQKLDEQTDLRISDNVRPRLDREQLSSTQEQLDSIYIQKQTLKLPGYPRLSSWTENIVPTSLAEGIVTRYIATQYNRDVLVADIGANSIGGFLTNDAPGNANPRAGTHAFFRVVKGDFGLSYGLPNLLREVGAAAVLRWLPFSFTEAELVEYALNRMVRPLSLSADERDLQIEHAFAREALHVIAARLREQAHPRRPSYDLLIGSGGLLANIPSHAEAAMLLLDGLEPEGLPTGSVELALDSTLLLPHIGTMALANPAAAAYVFDRDSLLWLGTVIVPLAAVPNPTPGQPAVTVTVEYTDSNETTKVEVPYGDLRLIPLRPDQRANLTVQPGRDFRVGSGERGKLVRTMGEQVKGGYVGLIVDARGRPLVMPADQQQRITTLLRWREALGIVSNTEQAITLPDTFATPDLPPLATRLALTPDAEQPITPTSFAGINRPPISSYTARPSEDDEAIPAWLAAEQAERDEVPAVANYTPADDASRSTGPMNEAEANVPPWLLGEDDALDNYQPAETNIPPWLRGADEDEPTNVR